MRVLAVVPGGISEQVLFFPTIEHLKQAFPKAEIAVITEPAAAAAYRVSQSVRETIPYTFINNNSPADWANLLGILRDREYEVLLTVTQNWSMGLLLWLSGVPTRIGYESGANSLFLTTTVADKPEQYQAYRYHDLLSPLHLDGPCPSPTLKVPQRDIDWVNHQTQSLGIDEQGYVLIYGGPAEGADNDVYPVESWQAIIQDFQSRQPGLPLVLVQQPETAEMVKALSQGIPNLNVIRPDNVGQMAALVAGANLMISTDSYPLQLGVALNVFTLGLFGANDTTRRLPPVEGAETRFLGIASESDRVADIAPETVMKKVWGEG